MQHSGLTTKAELSRTRKPVRQLVENRTIHESHEAVLSIYDTFEPAESVQLFAEEVLYCGMISGKKSLYADHQSRTDFLPHESFVMAPGESISIDFPEASRQHPTSCLTLGITQEKLIRVCDELNQTSPLPKFLGEWQPKVRQQLSHPDPDKGPALSLQRPHTFHTFHTEATQHLLVRIVDSFIGRDNDRDLVLNLGVTELLVRMLRQEGREFLLKCARDNPEGSELQAAVEYLEAHLNQPVGIDQLCRIACMSRSKLYARFKNIVGCGPMEYLQQRRLEKARQLIQSGLSVTRACFEVGYSNASHFTRRFQQKYGLSPREFAARYKPG